MGGDSIGLDCVQKLGSGLDVPIALATSWGGGVGSRRDYKTTGLQDFKTTRIEPSRGARTD